MPQLTSSQIVVGSSPQATFTVPAPVLAAGGVIKVYQNGLPVPFSWTGAAQITLKTAAPARAIIDFDNVTGASAAISAEAALDFPSIAAQSAAELTVSNVVGAALGDVVTLGLPANAPIGLVYSAYVSAVNTVKVRASNITAAAVDAASGTFRVAVQKV
jgi:hypothetical protein